ncbi:ATP-binding protein [Rhizobium sp. J15]|uniref:ATP-binding protein n=1 Tax=Rhizobium sp. J15 TaxID=2035450 RepID=UPI001142322F|nr:ATP-binding protein [Rhizobium sp. J15]
MREPTRPPQKLCFRENLDESMRFMEELRVASYAAIKSKHKVIDRSRGMPRVGGYADFSYPIYISTAAAVVLAAEFERLSKAYSEITPTVDLDRWNGDVFRKLYQIGFFEIVGITPKRDDVVIEEGATRTMQIVSTKNADDLDQVDGALQKLGSFINPDGNIPEGIIIELLTGLSEAMSNVTNHAYPADYEPDYPHIGQLWVAATADRENQSLTVVVYDQGITIPVTYPRIERLERVVNYLARTLKQRPEFDFQNDGTYIRAAMKHGGSRTDQRHRGKGLPQMVEVIERTGRGKLSVYSRGGWCVRDSNGRLRSGAVPFSIGGTLIEWTVELKQTSAVVSS